MKNYVIDPKILSVEEVDEYRSQGYTPRKITCTDLNKLGLTCLGIHEGDVLELCYPGLGKCTLVEVSTPCSPRMQKPCWVRMRRYEW